MELVRMCGTLPSDVAILMIVGLHPSVHVVFAAEDTSQRRHDVLYFAVNGLVGENKFGRYLPAKVKVVLGSR